MIEHALELQKSIDSLKKEIEEELARLTTTGNAKLCHWSDKYDSYSTWLLSEDADLLADVEIDGWICTDRNPLVRRSTGEILPRDDPRIIEVEF